MIRKHLILIGITISLLLLYAATRYYPGGSRHDTNSIGFDWQNNYLCNLFGPEAVNGSDNPSRYWAIAGMFFLCCSFALFFISFSKKIPVKSAAWIIKYSGLIAMVCAFLIATPLHDAMITAVCTLGMISIFYIAVFIFKSKLKLLKVFSVICLLSYYYCMYIYYTRSHLDILPVVQKINMVISVLWVLAAEYFTKRADFQPRKIN